MKNNNIGYWAEKLYEQKYVLGRCGNISKRLDDDNIEITSHDCYLGHLEDKNILKSDLKGTVLGSAGTLTSEKNIHLAVYKSLPEIEVVIHAHPGYTNALFYTGIPFNHYSMETRFYLGNVPVIPQKTVTIEVEPVIEALKNNNIVVLKNHGVIAVGKTFLEAFSLIEILDEQCKINIAMANKSQMKDDATRNNKPDTPKDKIFKMLSKEHVSELTNLVNNDEEVQKLGKQYSMSLSLAVVNEDTGDSMYFKYLNGKIIDANNASDAEFVIIGKTDILRKVFNREIDPFVASTQGKVKIKGDFSKMGKWYPVMVRTFKLWELAPVK